MEKDGFIDQLKDLVEKTENFTIAHCKEVFTSTVIKGRDIQEVVEEMRSMNNESLHSQDDSPKRKGSIGFSESDKTKSSGIDWKTVETDLRKIISDKKSLREKIKSSSAKRERLRKEATK